MLFGAGLGLLGGGASGVLIYFSLARIKTQQLFRVTNGLILLLAGSLTSQLAKSLPQSGLVDGAVEPLFYFGVITLIQLISRQARSARTRHHPPAIAGSVPGSARPE